MQELSDNTTKKLAELNKTNGQFAKDSEPMTGFQPEIPGGNKNYTEPKDSRRVRTESEN